MHFNYGTEADTATADVGGEKDVDDVVQGPQLPPELQQQVVIHLVFTKKVYFVLLFI